MTEIQLDRHTTVDVYYFSWYACHHMHVYHLHRFQAMRMVPTPRGAKISVGVLSMCMTTHLDKQLYQDWYSRRRKRLRWSRGRYGSNPDHVIFLPKSFFLIARRWYGQRDGVYS